MPTASGYPLRAAHETLLALAERHTSFMFARLPPGRRIAASALVAFCTAILIVTLLGGLSRNYAERLIQVAACAMATIVVLGAVISWVTGRLADYQEPADEEEFEALVRRSELLARENLAAEPDE